MPAMPKRIVKIDLPAPYDCFACEVWVNIGGEERAAFTEATNPERFHAAFGRMVVSHDFCDFDGKPLPPGGDPALYPALPDELAQLIFRGRAEQVGRLTKSGT